MPNSHGDFLWYELITTDLDAAAAFYTPLTGWTVRPGDEAMGDYRMFGLPSADIGGMLPVPGGAAGMKPGWMGYVAVDDVDATAAKAQELGGSQHVPPTDIPGVGRFAMLAAPDGTPFYVMRGLSDDASRSYDPNAIGHGNWNQLAAPDPAEAFTFLSALFGWTKGEAMSMGDLGEYQFLDNCGKTFGALMRTPPGGQQGWLFYFGVADIDVADARIREKGGSIISPPHEIPGGTYSLVAADPAGAWFGLVGPRKLSP